MTDDWFARYRDEEAARILALFADPANKSQADALLAVWEDGRQRGWDDAMDDSRGGE